MCTSSKRKEGVARWLFAASALFLSTALFAAPLIPIVTEADPPHDDPVLAGAIVVSLADSATLSALLHTNNASSSRRINVLITGYSSTFDQTDATPFITAANTWVRDGIVAANDFPFGTLVRFPELFGDKVFVVEDRLHPKNSHKIDIWFPNRKAAAEFGIQEAVMEILPEEV